MNQKSHLNILLVLSFGLFGLTALIFQVVFAKSLVLLFGLTAPAIATVLAVYFSGLAIGSVFIGKLVDRFQKMALRIYVLLFLLIGIYGLSFPFLFPILNKVIQTINQVYPLDFSGFNLFAFLLSFSFLIFPAILIGGGFPTVNKLIIRREERLGGKVSLVYFVETFGSVIGALLAGFWLIPAIGNNTTIIFASVLNLLIAGFLFVALRSPLQFTGVGPLQESESYKLQATSYKLKNPIFLYVLFFTGFLALALEVLYTKTLILFIGSSTYAFSLILITFLLGIALGSLIATSFIDRLKQGSAYFGMFLGILGFWLFLTLKFFEQLPFWYLKIFQSFESTNFSAIISTQFILTFLVIFPATFLMGIIFVLGIKLASPALGKLGEGIGKLYFANTFGGVLGSLSAGFFLLPAFGFQKTLISILLIYFFLGGIFIFREKTMDYLIRGILISFLIFWGAFSVLSPAWSKGILSLGVFPYAQNYLKLGEEEIERGLRTDEILFYKEGLSQITVIQRGKELILRVNGKTDASNSINDLVHQIPTGAFPLMLHPDPKEILVIGLGSGISLGSVTQFDKPEKINVVEIDPVIVTASDYFKEFNHDSLRDPRVNLVVADGRNYLYLTNKKYDVISSQPSNLWVSGNAYLFTKEYYELAKSRLKENGLMFQWIQVYNFELEDLKTVIRTFQEVFSYSYLFDDALGGNLFLVGTISEEPLLIFDEIEKKFESEKVQKELGRIFITNPYEFLMYFVSSGEILKEFAQDGKIHTDDRPLLEFSAPKALYKNTIPNTLREIYSMRKKINPLDFVAGGNEEEIIRYFEFAQKLVPVKISFAQGDLYSAIDNYLSAMQTGLSHRITEENFIKQCHLVAKKVKLESGSEAATEVWEKCGTIFEEPLFNEEEYQE